MSREKLIYIASPFAGDTEANIAFAKKACRYAIHQGHTPIAVHLLYPQMLDDNNPEERETGLQLGHRILGSVTNCGAAAAGSAPVWPVRLRKPSGLASQSAKLESRRYTRRLCPLRWSNMKLQGRAWAWHDAHHGESLRWDWRIPPRGGAQWNRAVMGQRDRNLPHRGDKKAVPLHAPCRGHHEVERR